MDFLTYCRRGKIIPIFKFSLDKYPEGLVRRFLEDPSLPLLRSRDLDFLGARYAWNECGYLRALREDRSLSQGIFEAFLALQDHSRHYPKEQIEFVSDILDVMLRGAESFEGIMWRRGHLALADFSPAMLLTRSLLSRDAGVPPALAIEAFGLATHLAIAQAFGSSLHEALEANDAILAFVARLFQPSPEAFTGSYVRTLHEILAALQVAYNPTIPATEYVEVFDSAETRRMRAIVGEVLEAGHQATKEAEIRERIQKFNDGVRKLRSRAIETVDVDVVGDLAKAGTIASGNATIGAILGILGIKLFQRAATRSFDAIVEDTALGSYLDRVRGLINGVPVHSIRLFRVRKKLRNLSVD